MIDIGSFCNNIINKGMDLLYYLYTIIAGWAIGGWLHTFKQLLCWILRKKSDPASYLKVGEWAIVTGCTDGIGIEFARQLYRSGFSLILISRTQSKLEALKEELDRTTTELHTITTKQHTAKSPQLCVYLAMDFSKSPDYKPLDALLYNKKVSVLVNNVGIGYDKPCTSDMINHAKMMEIINVNCVSMIDMTRVVLPHMPNGSIVVNVSSGSSLGPCPYMPIYSASKAFVNNWTDGMRAEYRNKIHFQSLIPFYIVSKLSHYTTETMSIPTAERYVESALTTLGQDQCTGYAIHDMMAYTLQEIFPKRYAEEYMKAVNKIDMEAE